MNQKLSVFLFLILALSGSGVSAATDEENFAARSGVALLTTQEIVSAVEDKTLVSPREARRLYFYEGIVIGHDAEDRKISGTYSVESNELCLDVGNGSKCYKTYRDVNGDLVFFYQGRHDDRVYVNAGRMLTRPVEELLAEGATYLTRSEVESFTVGKTEVWKTPKSGIYFQDSKQAKVKWKGKVLSAKLKYTDEGAKGGSVCYQVSGWGSDWYCQKYIHFQGAVAQVWKGKSHGAPYILLEGNSLSSID